MTKILNKLIRQTANATNLNYLSSRLYRLNIQICSKLDLQKAQIESGPQRCLKVAVIGVPNAGKSTFINSLVNHRACPTSGKVHTTRKSTKAILTIGNCQMVLSDTPGLVTQKEINKYKLEDAFKTAHRKAIQGTDIIAVIHDISNNWTRQKLHYTVLDILKAYPTFPSVLILNKIDTLKSKRVLLDLTKKLTNNTLAAKEINTKPISGKRNPSGPKIDILSENGWNDFSDVFMVSSVTGDGFSEILNYFQQKAKPGPWLFSSNQFTDDSPTDLIVNSVRARLLDYLPQEIPYKLRCQLEFFSESEDSILASVEVLCPSSRIERLICGEGNGRLRQITERTTSDLMDSYGKMISLTITTKTKKEFSDPTRNAPNKYLHQTKKLITKTFKVEKVL